MSRLRALIVDDEAPARKNLQMALGDFQNWLCVDACSSVAEARLALAQAQVDLIFLDIRMPREGGMTLAQELCESPAAPIIVFVTAYDQYAVDAFDVFALDYLLKPFDDERFAKTLARAEFAIRARQNSDYAQSVGSFLSEHAQVSAGGTLPPLKFIATRSTGLAERIAVVNIESISAAGNYVELHSVSRVIFHRASLSSLEARLPKDQFIRVHRSTLVRASAVMALKTLADDKYEATLKSGRVVAVSESFVKSVRALIAST